MEGDDLDMPEDYMSGEDMSPSGRRTPTWYSHT